MSVFDYMGALEPVLEVTAKRVNVTVDQSQRMGAGIVTQAIVDSVPDIRTIKRGDEDVEHCIEIKHLIQRPVFVTLINDP